ncbi:MAG: hypothetical protein JWN39_2393 [Ilumatobacteraceae bacterium]|nr:hypothetical protein [Ilumatobacteraceae bacterium]
MAASESRPEYGGLVAPIQLSRQRARQLAISAQLLSDDRPTDLVDTIGHLWAVQLDPTAAVAPSADLVAWCRLGNDYLPEQMAAALEVDRTLFEHRGFVRAMDDLALYKPLMAAWPSDEAGWARKITAWMDANWSFQRYLLDELEDNGPLMSRDLEDRAAEPWPSTGWTNNRNVTQMLEFLAAQGKVAISGRSGRQRLFDLAERVYPADVEVIDAAYATKIRAERHLASLGIARELVVGDVGSVAEIEGVDGLWRVDPDALAASSTDRPFTGRTAFVSPFDRLVHDRARLEKLFDFEYHLEMYTPAAKRIWGYYALPVLYDDEFVGAIDMKFDRKTSTLRVLAISLGATAGFEELQAVDDEIDELAAWLGATKLTRP